MPPGLCSCRVADVWGDGILRMLAEAQNGVSSQVPIPYGQDHDCPAIDLASVR
jgi:hypothetical protein